MKTATDLWSNKETKVYCELSVSLPLYKAKDIAWLAFEGLIRQKTEMSWELIIAEEDGQSAHKLALDYKESLLRAGCNRVKLITYESKVPLPHKWIDIANATSPESQVLVLQDADCYSHPTRLQDSWMEFRLNLCDWLESYHAVFFDFISKRWAEYHRYPDSGVSTGINVAIRTDRLRTVHKWNPRLTTSLLKQLNALMQKQQDLTKTFFTYNENNPAWKYGFDTNGHNFSMNAKDRSEQIATYQNPFAPMSFDPYNNIPAYIFDRLVKHNPPPQNLI